ncbi:DDT domain-containing protein DDR4 [Heracleum sosnowskyi]|uniref:DDT domain-containing protein DDR4 n=1 Tax=Heracleum sosnowskyi TaxID=360622 RepID=A0AAD8IZ41_9APIA|nr:DDT domain-containing protein DDR4 [Heracleum sosnowskyi]
MDLGDDRNVAPAPVIAHRNSLRQRWELASVLNFLTVFEPLIKSKLNVSAEEVEMAIIEPNDLLSRLHIVLLKGIPPVSSILNRPDAWISSLCRKLSEWWPWVADGDLPLTLNKGNEISEYKELEPTTRLLVLKALCEIRLIQGDAVSFVNDAVKTGSVVSAFQKDKLCGDEKGTSYWLDGDASIGFRLYKEVQKFDTKKKVQGKGNLQATNLQWETIATNLEEFLKVVGELSSSKKRLEVEVCKIVEANVVPVLEKLQIKKERAAKQKEREEKLISGFRNSGLTRACRTRKAVTYTYDEYDKKISEAISMQEPTKKRKTAKEWEFAEQQNDIEKVSETSSEESSGSEVKRREKSKNRDNKKESETTSQESSESDMKSQGGIASESEIVSDDDNSDVEYDDDINDASSEDGSALNSSDKENKNPGNSNRATYARRRVGLRWSKRVAGVDSSPAQDISKGAKDRPRRRPIHKSSLKSFVSPDSEEASSPADSSDTSSSGNLSDDSNS